MSLRVYVRSGNREVPYMTPCKTQQALSVDRYRYLQLVTANHVLILLRRGFGCHHLTEIAALFMASRAVTLL